MPRAPHIEKHFTAGLFVRDVVIGMADGLTVPFALAAGLSGAVQDTKLIVVGGLAEIAAGRLPWDLVDIWQRVEMRNITSRNVCGNSAK